MSDERCGCVVEFTRIGACGNMKTQDLIIHYCPKHAAAPKMHDAIKKVYRRIRFDSATHWHTVNDPDKIRLHNALYRAGWISDE